MFTTTEPQIITLSKVVEVLTSFRQEWEQFANGESLVDVKGSVGLMIFDFVGALALPHSEQVQVLGPALYQDIQDLLVFIPENGKGL